ncbi:tetratricopeptide repeat protein [Pseudodesulfovibrio cashew]|uniref:Tetratricopeptide repeat protein n=1 Tax=Pseudodesulfovibrio cashew TaxID=2678688 RepID=A0A6I6JFT8_9BACT|nr:tetratricopeptide repeat protein [Pseudodesulfovibrio cashew]QGY40039.1 tetratricopeptide repeat protein [Pseudodesulfovibrio cashew]
MEGERETAGVEAHSGEVGCTGLDDSGERLRCVFSTVTKVKLGTGTTARVQENRVLWYVLQRNADAYGVRKINPQFVPTGDETLIDKETLLAEYTPEVEIHNLQVEPAVQALKKTVAKGDKHRERNEPLSAEMYYVEALDTEVTNVRAIFGLGLIYLQRGDCEKGKVLFEELVQIKAAFNVEHKHLFNEFGIALRKAGMFDEAVSYYGRAVELADPDENLYYNLARVFFEKDDWDQAILFAAKSLDLDPNHQHALELCRFARALAGSETLRGKYKKPPVPEDVARQAEALLGGGQDELDLPLEFGGGELDLTLPE